MFQTYGNAVVPGQFYNPSLFGKVPAIPELPGRTLIERFQPNAAPDEALLERIFDNRSKIERGDTSVDLAALSAQLKADIRLLNRAVTSATSNLPVRENLQGMVVKLVPVDTPLRNRLARVPGAGTAAAWRQATSLGGGWVAGDQPGEGPGVLQMFYSESGAPVQHTTVYAAKSAAYKLMGVLGGITGFAEAVGASFGPQMEMEKLNAIENMMLNEENALINGDSTSIVAPWGDGVNALAFNGLLNLVTVANGVPAAQVQAVAGALTTSIVDSQLRRTFNQGNTAPWILCNGIEALSFNHLLAQTGAVQRIIVDADQAKLGQRVMYYVHPCTNALVPILISKFMPAGTLVIGSDKDPRGQGPALQVNVLPQIQLPSLAPGEMIQGYVARDIPVTVAAVDVFNFVITCYEVLQMFASPVFAKLTGLTAV